MPKRLLDGDRIWTSDKLGKIEPDSFRAEYANLIPLALANGSFECSSARVWRDVYSYNRTSFSVQKVDKLLRELERVRLLFRWVADDKKVWGFFIGMTKSGLLPSESQLSRKDYKTGEEPPKDLLDKFLSYQIDSGLTPNTPQADPTAGLVGFGIGLEREGKVRQKSGNLSTTIEGITKTCQEKLGVPAGKLIYFRDGIKSLIRSYEGNQIVAAFERWCEDNPTQHKQPVSAFIHSAERYLREEVTAKEPSDILNTLVFFKEVADVPFIGTALVSLKTVLRKYEPKDVLETYKEFVKEREGKDNKWAPKDFAEAAEVLVLSRRKRIEELSRLEAVVEKNIEILQKQDVPAEEEPNDPMFDVVE